MWIAALPARSIAGLTLMGAAAVLYIATRIAVMALSRPDGTQPGRHAIGQWLPIAAATLAAIIARRADIALALVFGTSVAALSLVLGLLLYLAPLSTLPPSKRLWPFVFPAALLTLMAGFGAALTWWHAIMLLLLGTAILRLWLSPSAEQDGSSENHPGPAAATALVAGAIAIMAVAGWYAVQGTISSSVITREISAGTLAATILSPLLVMPTLGVSSALAQRGYPGRAVTTLVGTVLLNLCLLLPLAILLWYPGWQDSGGWHWGDFRNFRELRAPWNSVHALPFASATWRIENVVVVILGFALVPISSGKWALGKLEGNLLIAGYAVYILVLAVFSGQV